MKTIINRVLSTGIGFSSSTVPPDSKGIQPGSSNQEDSQSAGKNTGIVLVPCHSWRCVPTAIPCGLDISKVPRCHFQDR